MKLIVMVFIGAVLFVIWMKYDSSTKQKTQSSGMSADEETKVKAELCRTQGTCCDPGRCAALDAQLAAWGGGHKTETGN